MATQAQVLQRIEQVEYLKEAARTIAGNLLNGADVAELIDNVPAFVDAIMVELTAKLGPLARRMLEEARAYAEELGFEASSLDFEAIAAEEHRQFITDLRPVLLAAAAPIHGQILDMLHQGVSVATISVALASGGLGAVLLRNLSARIRQAAGEYLAHLHQQTMAAMAHTALADLPEALLTWITVQDRSVCNDETVEGSCKPRHGERKSFSEWEPLGHPWVPNRICRDKCRCVYMTSDWELITEPVDATEAVKGGKRRALADFGQPSA